MWYIMSYNQIVGFSSGAFHDLRMLFYAGPDNNDGSLKWVPLVTQAKAFDSQLDAMTHAKSVWGSNMADDAFGYVFFPKTQEWRDLAAQEVLDRRDAFKKKLVSRRMSKEELLSFVPGSINNPATPPEQWIIQAMKA